MHYNYCTSGECGYFDVTLRKSDFHPLLFNIDPTSLKVPIYVDEGLEWLEEKLNPSLVKVTESKVAARKEGAE